MSTNQTKNQTTALSAIREHVIVSEVPVLNLEIKIITNSRKIDASKVGMNSELVKSLPDTVLTKFEQVLVPKSATNALEAARKAAEKVLKSRAVFNKLFGWIIGHDDVDTIEDEILKIQQGFYRSLMNEEDYNLKCAQIIEALNQDPVLIHQPWHGTFVEISRMRQPSWGEYIEGCSFDLSGFYIGEAGTMSGKKMKSADNAFEKIFTSTKGVLIKEVSEFASSQLSKAYKARSKDQGVKEVSWKLAYELCDKLKGLSFVSANIAKAESEIRSKFLQVLPESGTIHGITRENYITILSALSDPFRLADKVDSGLPLFKVDDVNLEKNNDENLSISYEETEETVIEPIPVMVVEEIIEVSSKEHDEEETISNLEALIETDTHKTTTADDFISQSAEMVNTVSDFSDLSHDDLMSSLGF